MLKINNLVYQGKDIDPKPSPFYHIPEPYETEDPERGKIKRVRWVEDPGLKRKHVLKAELGFIYDRQDELLKLQFEPVRAGIERFIDDCDYNRIAAILQSPFLSPDLQSIADELYDKYIEIMEA